MNLTIFFSVADKLASKTPPVNLDPLYNVQSVPNSFVYFETSEVEICIILNSFPSKQSHIETIPSFIFKSITDLISPILANLINISVTSGYFPTFMKTARVVPIYKSGFRNNKTNYRPISTLPFLSKVYERLMHNRLMDFCVIYNVLYDDQYAFRHSRSTTDAILKFNDICYASLNNENYLISVFLDFSRAFDTVVHIILCGKLEKCGVRGGINRWFRSYLTGRSQYVDVNGECSAPVAVTYSVPQGSILGPLCFLIYINDMYCCTNLNIIHFADDGTAFSVNPSLDAVVGNINNELFKLDNWLCANKLSLNVVKSSYAIYTNKPVNSFPPIKIRNVPLTHVNRVKFWELTWIVNSILLITFPQCVQKNLNPLQ